MSVCLPPGCPPLCPPGCPPACPPGFFLNEAQSCDVQCKDGVPFTWTQPAGTVLGRTQAEANFLAGALACKRAQSGKICFLTAGLPSGKVGTAYDQTISAMGGVPWQFPFLPVGCASFGTVPYAFSLDSGALPDGLTLGCLEGGRAGQIMGTPTLGGTFTFIVRVTDAVGAYQRKQFSIRIDGTEYGNITPPIFSNVGSSWPGFPAAGTYRVSYVKGALRYGNNDLWLLNIAFASKGFYIRHSNGASIIEFPGTNDTYGSQALVEAANAGRQITINHTGGAISMYLDDINYGDNHAGDPNPTFRLSS